MASAPRTRAESLKRPPGLRVILTNDTLSINRSYFMKTTSKFLAILAVSAFAFLPVAVHAQDQPPPPPMDNGGAPPPPPDNSAPPPDNYTAAPPDGSGAPPPADASGGDDSGTSFQEFYDQLGSQGQWVQTDNYGYAFQPTVTDPNWAPYTDGHWAYTDVGWTWVSDEPWGWATYHYGRWVNIDGTGWVWVPGYTWAPAWVSWRYGGGYCGWAPLPPSTLIGVDFAEPGVNIGIGFSFGSDCDTAFGIGPGCYNFIPIGYIGNPYYHGYYLDRSRNFVVINQTRNVTNIRYYSGRPVFGGVTVGGPSLAEVNAHSRTHIEQMHLAATGTAGRSTINGGTLNIYAPRVNPATVRQARPTTVARTLTGVKVNRGTSITHLPAVNAELRPAAPSEAAIRAAEEAQAKAPASAHIATAKTVPKTTFSKPLTSLQTATEVRRTMPAASNAASGLSAQQQRQDRAATDQQERQQAAAAEQTQRQDRAATDQQERQQAAAAEQTQRQDRAATDQQDRQAAAAAEQKQRQDRAATDQQDRQAAAAAEQKQREEAAANEQAQASERAAAAEQSQAEAAQRERAAAAAAQERAPATQERAPSPAIERAPVPQERAPAPQQHAPAAQPHAAPASGGNGKNPNIP